MIVNKLILVAVTAAVIIAFHFRPKTESFTAAGLVLNKPSEWWYPTPYDPISWLVPMYLDQLSQPQCLSYNRGDPGPLNFNASAYRLWRF